MERFLVGDAPKKIWTQNAPKLEGDPEIPETFSRSSYSERLLRKTPYICKKKSLEFIIWQQKNLKISKHKKYKIIKRKKIYKTVKTCKKKYKNYKNNQKKNCKK